MPAGRGAVRPPSCSSRAVGALRHCSNSDIANNNNRNHRSRSGHAWLSGGSGDIESFADDWYKLHILTDGKCGDAYAFEQITKTAVKQYWYAIKKFALLLLDQKTIEGDALFQSRHDLVQE